MKERKEGGLYKVAQFVKLVKALEFEGNTKKNDAIDTLEMEGTIRTFLENKKLVDFWSSDINVHNFTLAHK